MTNKTHLPPSELLLRLFLHFDRDYFYLENYEDIIDPLKIVSAKRDFIGLFDEVTFFTEKGVVRCPDIVNGLDEINMFYIIIDKENPNLYHINKQKILEITSKLDNTMFQKSYGFDKSVRKAAQALEKAMLDRHEARQFRKQRQNG